MQRYKIFIVEDDEWYGQFLHYHISMNPDYDTELINSGDQLLKKLSENPSLITLDFSMPTITGDKLLIEIKKQLPHIPVLIISGQEDISTAVQLLKEGAYDYIVKNENTKDQLRVAIQNALEHQSLKQEVQYLREKIVEKHEFSTLIKGESSELQAVFQLMKKAAMANINVSITGETGTGKELVAQAIHYNSKHKNKPFVTVNIAAIPKDLIESELFGHEKGAFTGAINQRIGKFEEAQGGTIFLDEIGDMDINVQVKLLRVLQEREVTKIGSNKAIKINTRVIVATHKNLSEQVKIGAFREDLYYRIIGMPVQLPPLRERGNDIILLSDYFIEQFCEKNHFKVKTLTKEAKKQLLKHSYPGNIRELKSIIELAIVMSDDDFISENDINFNSVNHSQELLKTEMTLKEYNNQIIQYYLNKYNDNVLLVAEKLNIGKSTIYRMLKQEEL